MAKLPSIENTRDSIFKAWEDNDDNSFRQHLGASIIGRKCDRELWYSFHWCTKPNFSGRILKLFDRGHSEEARFVHDLKLIGCEVKEFDENGNQWRFEAHGGHFGGSSDGIIASGVIEAPKSPHIVEFKTHGSKSFKTLDKGVQEAKPEHYTQMQMYMGLSGDKWGAKYRIERALYMAVNKDNDDLYCERVKFDKEHYQSALKKAENIIFSTKSIDGISDNPSWYECKFCDHYSLCHEQKLPEVNCRTCAHSTPERDGSWSCSYTGVEISHDYQVKGCDYHLFNPNIVDKWLTAIDGTDDSIVFEVKGVNTSNPTWINGIDNITSLDAFHDDIKCFLI